MNRVRGVTVPRAGWWGERPTLADPQPQDHQRRLLPAGRGVGAAVPADADPAHHRARRTGRCGGGGRGCGRRRRGADQVRVRAAGRSPPQGAAGRARLRAGGAGQAVRGGGGCLARGPRRALCRPARKGHPGRPARRAPGRRHPGRCPGPGLRLPPRRRHRRSRGRPAARPGGAPGAGRGHPAGAVGRPRAGRHERAARLRPSRAPAARSPGASTRRRGVTGGTAAGLLAGRRTAHGVQPGQLPGRLAAAPAARDRVLGARW